MATGDPQEILIRHNAWATEQIIGVCERLDKDQLHHQFEMGLGTLTATLHHILGTLRAWGDLLAEREPRMRLEKEDLSFNEMRTLLEAVSSELLSLSQQHSPEEIVEGKRGGQTYRFTRGAVVTHVTTHGMHHRAQCINMLRQLGVSSLPPSSILEWTLMVDSSVETGKSD